MGHFGNYVRDTSLFIQVTLGSWKRKVQGKKADKCGTNEERNISFSLMFSLFLLL